MLTGDRGVADRGTGLEPVARRHGDMYFVVLRYKKDHSQPPSTSPTLASGGVRWDRSNILDTPDAHSRTGECTEGALRAGAGGLGACTTGSAELDVEGVDANLAAAGSDVLGGEHGGVGGGLVTVSFYFHAAGDAGDGFFAGEIGDVDESVIEGCEDVCDAEDVLALCYLGAEGHGIFFFCYFYFFRWHFDSGFNT